MRRHLPHRAQFRELFHTSTASKSLQQRLAITRGFAFPRKSWSECCAPFRAKGIITPAAGSGILHVGCGGPQKAQGRVLRLDNDFLELRIRRITTTTIAAGTMAEGQDGGSSYIKIGGSNVPLVAGPGVTESDLERAADSTILKQWSGYMTGHDGILTIGGSGGSRCSLRRLTIQNVDYFGRRLGFVKFRAEVIDEKTGASLPGIVFGRGGSVGMLMLLECEGVKYAVLTEQARVAVGRTLVELPAGMLDADAGDFVGAAAREIEEETGITVKTSDLVDLTALLDENTGRKMFPSAGGSDEDITLFLYRGTIEKETMQKLQGAETGLRDHGELIRVHVVPYSTLWRSTSDAKALAAIALYEMASKEGVLPPAPNAPELSNL